jgi:hypothetical protein
MAFGVPEGRKLTLVKLRLVLIRALTEDARKRLAGLKGN